MRVFPFWAQFSCLGFVEAYGLLLSGGCGEHCRRSKAFHIHKRKSRRDLSWSGGGLVRQESQNLSRRQCRRRASIGAPCCLPLLTRSASHSSFPCSVPSAFSPFCQDFHARKMRKPDDSVWSLPSFIHSQRFTCRDPVSACHFLARVFVR